jgi:hypothetical protein
MKTDGGIDNCKLSYVSSGIANAAQPWCLMPKTLLSAKRVAVDGNRGVKRIVKR